MKCVCPTCPCCCLSTRKPYTRWKPSMAALTGNVHLCQRNSPCKRLFLLFLFTAHFLSGAEYPWVALSHFTRICCVNKDSLASPQLFYFLLSVLVTSHDDFVRCIVNVTFSLTIPFADLFRLRKASNPTVVHLEVLDDCGKKVRVRAQSAEAIRASRSWYPEFCR
jgi:hypothetical protein